MQFRQFKGARRCHHHGLALRVNGVPALHELLHTAAEHNSKSALCTTRRTRDELDGAPQPCHEVFDAAFQKLRTKVK